MKKVIKRKSNSGKLVFISILSIVLLGLLAGVAYKSNGFRNWNVQEWFSNEKSDLEYKDIYKIEAEDYTVLNTVECRVCSETSDINYSGEGYLGYIAQDASNHTGECYVEYEFNSSAATVGKLFYRLAFPSEEKMYLNTLRTTVNGVYISVDLDNDAAYVPGTGSWVDEWETYEYALFNIKEGINTIRITFLAGAFCNIDYLLIGYNFQQVTLSSVPVESNEQANA